MFVDASALIAILCDEADGKAAADALERSRSRLIISVVAVWETVAGVSRKQRIPVSEAKDTVLSYLDAEQIEIVPIAVDDLLPALEAFDRFGRHRYPEAQRSKGLNLADCFHYACAKRQQIPLLHKDAGLRLTDIASVGVEEK